jgi:hypothetical protein
MASCARQKASYIRFVLKLSAIPKGALPKGALPKGAIPKGAIPEDGAEPGGEAYGWL